MKYEDLPQTCPLGPTERDIKSLLTPEEEKDLWRFMRGQTMSGCDGRAYDHDKKEYYATECADTPHGGVVYRHDFLRFVHGLPVID